MRFVRFQSAIPDRYGGCPGVFSLMNGLADSASLHDEAESWWRMRRRLWPAPCIAPSSLRSGTPPLDTDRLVSWFIDGTDYPEQLALDCMSILERHGAPTTRLTTNDPGRIIKKSTVTVTALDVHRGAPLHRRTVAQAATEAEAEAEAG